MLQVEVKNGITDLGVYRIYWKDGGSSVASVGYNVAGDFWYAPSNWITVPSFDWTSVKYIKLIETQKGKQMTFRDKTLEEICRDLCVRFRDIKKFMQYRDKEERREELLKVEHALGLVEALMEIEI